MSSGLSMPGTGGTCLVRGGLPGKRPHSRPADHHPQLPAKLSRGRTQACDGSLWSTPASRRWRLFPRPSLHILLVGFSRSAIETVAGLAMRSNTPVLVSTADVQQPGRWPDPTQALRTIELLHNVRQSGLGCNVQDDAGLAPPRWFGCDRMRPRSSARWSRCFYGSRVSSGTRLFE